MSNLAYKVNRDYQEQQQQQVKKKIYVQRRASITLGEKMLGLLFAAALLFCSIEIISNQVAIYSTNIEIQHLETDIQSQAKVNGDLQVQVQELSTYERIWGKALELGLFLNQNNVKVVHD
ncbi:cell division protein FtsL [Bacillus timonensis]|nr:cell division protein FtsL [Bacillus timonensis]